MLAGLHYLSYTSASRLNLSASDDSTAVLRDRTFIEQMKADILRRAEEVNYSDEENEWRDIAFEEELDGIDVSAAVKVGGDGEESDEDDEEGEGVESTEISGKGKEREKASPETLLEMVYIRDPKVFERDAATRRGKERVALRAQTGMLSLFEHLLWCVWVLVCRRRRRLVCRNTQLFQV